MTDVVSDVPQNGLKQDIDNRPPISEYGLRDEVLNDIESGGRSLAYTPGSFKLYSGGVWEDADDYKVRRLVCLSLMRLAGRYSISLSRATETNITDLLKSLTHKELHVWNSNPNIIVFNNTAFDVDTMEPVKHDPDHMATVRVPYDYDPQATCPTWDYVVNDRFGKPERQFLQEWFGYCLTTSTKHQITLWLVGPRGGGRSTIMRGATTMLGKLAYPLSLSKLQGNGSQFALSNIPNKTLLFSTENPVAHIKATETLNALVTGDELEVEQKFKQGFAYRNTAKLMWAMNSLPGLYDTSNGLFRRVKIMETEAIPVEKRDPEVIERVGLEGPGILNWALEGLERLEKRGRFELPQSVKASTAKYIEENDLPLQFVKEGCETPANTVHFDTKHYRATAQELADAFNQYLEDMHYQGEWNTKRLDKEWKRQGFFKADEKNGLTVKSNKGILWYGVRIK